ncbi:hypothetical protein O5188_24300, partial [Escherichia coli]|nr:hypothetical protein [Escherichia coli]
LRRQQVAQKCQFRQEWARIQKSFEAIVGLEVEFTEAAQKTLNTIKELDLIEGLDVIEQAILHKPSLRKILTHIAEKGNHTVLEKND